MSRTFRPAGSEEIARLLSPAVGSLVSLGHLNALDLLGLCDPVGDDRPEAGATQRAGQPRLPRLEEK